MYIFLCVRRVSRDCKVLWHAKMNEIRLKTLVPINVLFQHEIFNAVLSIPVYIVT